MERSQPISDLKEIPVRILHLDPIEITGDRILFQSAFHNVLDNAIKYSSSGKVVDVSLEIADGGFEIIVSDSGPGFSETDRGTLLERFERGENADTVVGSGLGLTIADEVVRAHGGTITLSNNSGGGACVTLSFPSD